MFYCIICKQTHEKSSSAKLFLTGFRSLPNGEKVPLGYCNVHKDCEAHPTCSINTH